MSRANKYTPEQEAFLIANKTLSLEKLSASYSAKFEQERTLKALSSFFKNREIQRGRPKPGKGNGTSRIFTPEQCQWINDNYAGHSVVEMTDLFNAKFEKQMTWQQIKTFVHNRGIVSGRTGHFEKGQLSWNKGVKGYMGANATSFKTGNAPPNRKPLGTERICSKDGFILIKIAETDPHTGFPTRYKHKHVWLWEQTNGPVPEGHVVAFRDGNKLNCVLENLMMITRAELLALNLHNYKDAPDEIKPTILALAKVEAKAGVRSRPGRGRKSNQEAQP